MRLATLGLFVLSAASCVPEPAAPGADEVGVPSTTIQPLTSAAPMTTGSAPLAPPAASPTGDLARRFPQHQVDAIASWRQALGGEDVVAVVITERKAADPRRSLSWFRASEAGEVPAGRSYPLSESGPAHLGAIDLDGDGANELLVFGAEAGMFGSVDVFRLVAGADQPLAVGPAAAAIDGAATLEEVSQRLPLTAPLDEAKLAAASTAAIIGRLALASIADLRAMTSRKGLELCDSVGVNQRDFKTRCRTVTGAKLTDAVLKDEVQHALLRALEPLTVMGFDCKKEQREACHADISGANSVTIELAGEGAARRLAKITRTDGGIGE